MRRTLTHIIGLLCTIYCCAQQPVFVPIDTSKGLSDNFVLHIIQLHDGRIAATTPSSIDLWDGHSFMHIAKDTATAIPLTGYKGAYHVYTDKENRLWVKDNQRLWCYGANLAPQPDCLPDSANDVFVDDAGEVFFVHQDTTDMLLDLKTLNGRLYRFYASGYVRCSQDGKELYAVRAPLDSTAITSLVITDTLRKKFYQLVDQRLCLEFDTQQQRWVEIFRSKLLHTISQTSANTALIVSHDGMWEVDLNSRHVKPINQVTMSDGSYISSSRLNTICTDKEGNIWIGSYDHGLLQGSVTPPAITDKAGWWLIIILAIIAAGTVVACIGWKQVKGRKNKAESPNPATDSQQSHSDLPLSKKTEKLPQLSSAEEALIQRATTLVEEHLATTNYTVERLAQDLCMDRTGLYKKMMTMLGKTPTVFIRSIREEHAVRLIQEGKLTMAEVAEQTGFSSASYMAKCFQEDLGHKPAEYRANQQECSVEST